MTYGQDDLGTPFPLTWWNRRAGLATRNACRKQLRLAHSLGLAVAAEVRTDVARRIKAGNNTDSTLVAGYHTRDLVPIIRLWGLPTLDRGLDDAIITLAIRDLSGDAELRAWIADNTAEIRDLAAWFALYDVAYELFSTCPFVITDLEDEVRMVSEGSVSSYAMAQADLVMCTRTVKDMMILVMLHDVARLRETLPPPPWDL